MNPEEAIVQAGKLLHPVLLDPTVQDATRALIHDSLNLLTKAVMSLPQEGNMERKFKDTLTGAVAYFGADADKAVSRFVAKLIEDGDAEWVLDPQVQGCYALIALPDTNKAHILVYGPSHFTMEGEGPTFDWEMSDEFSGMLSSYGAKR